MTKTIPKPKKGEGNAEAETEAPIIKAPKNCRQCSRWAVVRRQMNIASILGKAAKTFESTNGKFQPTVAEYLKLVQIEQEYEKDLNPPEEIQVTWVEPPTES
jgi:hypothetical protein